MRELYPLTLASYQENIVQDIDMVEHYIQKVHITNRVIEYPD